MKRDPYLHLPHLRERLTPPATSALRVTDEVLAAWDARAVELGRPSPWRLSDEQREATRHALLGAWCAPAADLWVYGYGSLMWDPAFHFTEVRMAELHGHQRRFSYRTSVGRGSAECPGLVLTLERGEGCCIGLAFRIEAARVQEETMLLWRREMLRGGYRPALLPMATPQGEIEALVFTVNPAHPEYVGELPLDQTAQAIARAAGTLGSNRSYLEQVAAQLQLLGIADAYIEALAQRVQSLDGP